MKTKSKIPALRFKGFTDAWEERKLEDISEIIDGDRGKNYPSGDDFKNNGHTLFLSAANVTKQGFVFKETQYITKLKSESLGSGKVILNDIILTSRGSIGHIGFYDKKTHEYIPQARINSGMLILRTDKLNSPSFIAQFLKSPWGIKQIKLISFGSAQPQLTKKDIKNFKIILPKMEEQQKISSFFKHLDDTIALHQRKCDQTKELKKTMLQKMFPKKGERIPEIRFPEFTDEWEEKKLGEVGETFTGLSGKTKADFGHGAGKFVTYVNVFNNPISDLKGVDSIEIDDNQKQVQYGDILITTSSETPEEVGMTSVWLGREENVYLNSFCFGFRPTTELSSYYMAYALRSHEVRKKFIILAQGISRYNISKTKVMEINIPIPSLPEQEAIGAYFQTLDQDIAQIEKKLADLKELKKALLRQLFV